MLKKVVCAVAILGMSLGLAVAEELKGKITEIKGHKITFQTYDKETKKFADAKTYDIAKDCKVCKKTKDAKEEIKEGLKAEVFTKIGDKGLFATLNVTDGNVTEIVISGKKKKASN